MVGVMYWMIGRVVNNEPGLMSNKDGVKGEKKRAGERERSQIERHQIRYIIASHPITIVLPV